MTDSNLSEEQAYWLRRLLETRPRDGKLDTFTIPDAIHDVLVDRGLIHWHKGSLEITFDGIVAIARYKPFLDPQGPH